MIDLHIHSSHSDGSYAPHQIAQMASELNLTAISITDHDSVDGVVDGKLVSEKLKVKFIPGVEISTKYQNKGVHLLGYFIDWTNIELSKTLKHLRTARIKRANKTLDILKNKGLSISYEEVQKISDKGSVGRVHIAKALLARGYVRSISEAFDLYLAAGRPAYVEKEVLQLGEAINLIRDSGGFAFIAHPGIEKLYDCLDKFVGLGVYGVEVYHPNHTEDDIVFFKEYAKRKNLLCSGGSDFHGENSSTKKVLGQISVPDKYADKLFEARGCL